MGVRFRVIEKDGQEFVEEIHKVVVHRFKVGEVEDPDIYAAEPIHKWEKSEQGQFVMDHAIETPEWHRNLNFEKYEYDYSIVAELEKKKLSEFYLRFGRAAVK